MMDSETLKSVGVLTIGQRLHILKAVYMIKLAHNVPFEQDDYVPPCTCQTLFESCLTFTFITAEVEGRSESLTIEKLHATVKDQG